MKILYDHQIFSTQIYGGISRYFCELMKRLPNGYKQTLSVLASFNQHLHESRSLTRPLNIPILNHTRTLDKFMRNRLYNINEKYSKNRIKSSYYDIFHPTYYNNYFLNSLTKPYVITVHDLTVFKIQKKNFKEEESIMNAVENATRIICISNSTKNELIRLFGTKEEKIDVVYHGFNRVPAPLFPNNYGNYLLYVGKRDGYKNFIMLLYVLSELFIKEKDLRLVCVGEPFSCSEQQLLLKFKLTEKVLSVRANDIQLFSLFSYAKLFVYPSIYEGFGMPILDAFSAKCPVCLSDIEAFREIGGDGVSFFNPLDKISMYDTIKTVLHDESIKKELIEKGENRLEIFSWEKTIVKTLGVYHKAIAS